jgi:hypothetical protein
MHPELNAESSPTSSSKKMTLREWRLIREGEWTEDWCRDGETLLMHLERYTFDRDRGLLRENLFLERHSNDEFVIGWGGPGGSRDIARSKNRSELQAVLRDDDAIAQRMAAAADCRR